MKKFILTLLLCGITAIPTFAVNDVSFIYINGSNNNNEKMKMWYENGVKKLHPALKKSFEKDNSIKQKYAEYGGIKITQEPIIFFWGDKSENDLSFVKNQLDISKAISSYGAYVVRSLIAQYMHDAIWVQKTHNMIPILNELNEKVKEEVSKGKDVILYGYSAGTFITYEYLFNKLRYIDLEKLFESRNVDADLIKFVKDNPRKKTCVSALSYNNSYIGNISETGNIVLNQNIENLKENYLKIDEATEIACAPEKIIVKKDDITGKETYDKAGVKGIVNFACPLVLFYSDLADTDYELNYFNKLMTKYIFENGVFWLTVNFREDPLGFPTSRNLTVKEIQEKLNLNIENPSGTIYDNSSVWSKRFFALAHTSYWSARKTFSKAVVKSLVEGYKYQYDPEYQAKIIKRNNKKIHL